MQELFQSGRGYFACVTVPNRLESVRPAAAFLVYTARALQIAAASRPLFEVGVTEALTNAVKHGHGLQPGGTIRCEVELVADELSIRILDDGPGFAVPSVRAPAVNPKRMEALRESGYGLPIIQSVFPVVRGIRANGRFGLELILPVLHQ